MFEWIIRTDLSGNVVYKFFSHIWRMIFFIPYCLLLLLMGIKNIVDCIIAYIIVAPITILFNAIKLGFIAKILLWLPSLIIDVINFIFKCLIVAFTLPNQIVNAYNMHRCF